AACQDPRHLQTSVPEGHGAVPRRTRRPRILAARRGAEPGDRGSGRPAGTARVLRDGSLPHSHTGGGRAMNAMTARGLSLAAGVAMGPRAVTIEGGFRVAIARAIGAALGFVAERVEHGLPR